MSSTVSVPLLEPIGLWCEITSHTINLVRLGVVCANDNLSRIVNIGRVEFLEKCPSILSGIDMLVELFQDCLLSNEFSAGIYIEEYALEALFGVQLESWPFPALVSFRNAIDPLLVSSQEKLRKPAHLFIIFLP